MTHPVAARAATVLVAAWLSSCTTAPTSPDTVETLAPLPATKAQMLSRAQTLWAASGVTNYDFTIGVYCFCLFPQPLSFQVRNGHSSTPGLDARLRARVAFIESVEALFAVLNDTLARNPVQFDVHYHPVLGYPMSGFLDGAVDTVDDEFGFVISNLQPVP